MKAFAGWKLRVRETGQPVVVCPCGVEHSSRKLSERLHRPFGAHTCDGCCATPSGVRAEALILARLGEELAEAEARVEDAVAALEDAELETLE